MARPKYEDKKAIVKKAPARKRPCKFCGDSNNPIDYRRPKMLAHFLTERGKIAPRRVSGNCQFHQLRLVEAIKRARHLALLPYSVQHAIRD